MDPLSLMNLGFGLYEPIFPIFLSKYTYVVIGCFLSAFFLGKLVSWNLRFDKRFLLILPLALVGIGLINSMWALIFFSFIHGLLFAKYEIFKFSKGAAFLLIVGMVLGGVIAHQAGLEFIFYNYALISIIAYLLFAKERSEQKIPIYFLKKKYWKEYALGFLHNFHYFGYSWALPLVLIWKFNAPLWQVGIIFALGWILYLPGKRIWSKVKLKPNIIATVGMTFAGLLLIGMWMSTSIRMFSFLWLLIGLCASAPKVVKESLPKHRRVSYDFFWLTGAIFAPIIASIIALNYGLNTVFVFGSVFALLAGLFSIRKPGYTESAEVSV